MSLELGALSELGLRAHGFSWAVPLAVGQLAQLGERSSGAGFWFISAHRRTARRCKEMLGQCDSVCWWEIMSCLRAMLLLKAESWGPGPEQRVGVVVCPCLSQLLKTWTISFSVCWSCTEQPLLGVVSRKALPVGQARPLCFLWLVPCRSRVFEKSNLLLISWGARNME